MFTTKYFQDLNNVQLENANWDYPDFSDAYVSYAEYNGIPLTEAELDELNSTDFPQEHAYLNYSP